MIIFPYGTDAPIYYRPFITILMIVANVVVFYLEMTHGPEQIEPYMLAVGDGLHPVQWLTHNFLHADFMHLLGNMLFLWSFGLVVEGKLGPWKTLFVYLSIGILHGATVQFLTLHNEPTHCLGASAIVYGMMVLCLIWAPENSMDCLFVFIFMLIIRVGSFEVPIKIMVGLFLALQVFVLWLTDWQLSSEYLHTVGAVIGLGFGLVFLRQGWVDCEHWDIFSVWAGRHKMTPEDRKKLEENRPAALRQKAEELRKRQELLSGEISHAIAVGNIVPAQMLIARKKVEFPNWRLPESEMLRMIHLLSEQKMTNEAIAYMREYITLYESKAPAVRLRLAQTYMALDQPATALRELAWIDVATLNDRQRQYLDDLRRMAEQRKADKKTGDGLYELAD